MGIKRENSGISSHVLKKMSCQAGLDNYCHWWDVSEQENQIIMMSSAQCLSPSQQPVINVYGLSVLGSLLCISHTLGCTTKPFVEQKFLPRVVMTIR